MHAVLQCLDCVGQIQRLKSPLSLKTTLKTFQLYVKPGLFVSMGFLQISSSAHNGRHAGNACVAGAGIRHEASFDCCRARAILGVAPVKQTTAGMMPAITTI